MSKIPISIYTEVTPNPSTMKFVANKYLSPNQESVDFKTKSQTIGYSQLAAELFDFPFVKGVFVSSNFITITKNDALSWDFVKDELREFIREYLVSGKDVLQKLPEKTIIEHKTFSKNDLTSEVDIAIMNLLDEYVKPAVEGDGGAIEFLNYQDGIVTVALKGACSGCPSSTATLKGGIEQLLKQHIPEIKEVVAENQY